MIIEPVVIYGHAYQQAAARTRQEVEPIVGKNAELLHAIVGNIGEAGELLELGKKVVFNGHPIDLEQWKKELGDQFWYLADICTTLGLDAGEVMAANIEKLRVRYPGAYNHQDSIQRADVTRDIYDYAE